MVSSSPAPTEDRPFAPTSELPADTAKSPPDARTLPSATTHCPGDLGEAVSAADREAAFRALAGPLWTNAGCSSSAPLAPTCTKLSLGADGAYTFGSVSDYTERDDAGRWNFAIERTSPTLRGVLCLDGQKATAPRSDGAKNAPSALAFELDGTRLTAGSYTFAAGDARIINRDAAALGPIAVPAGWARMIGAWTKSNRFDLHSAPLSVEFQKLGRFSASYRDGACVHGGSFSWDRGVFTPTSDPNTCDERGGTTASIAASNDEPDFLGDLLVFYASAFRPEPAGPQVFVFDPYSRSLRVRGEMDAVPKTGAETTVRLQFDNLDAKLPRVLDGLKVSISSLTRSPAGDGFQSATPPKTLVEKSFGVTIPVSGTHADTIAFTPDVSGTYVQLSFELRYHDEHQPYQGERSYILAIAP